MNQKIDQLVLPNELSNYVVAGNSETLSLMVGLSIFNFFVGANNSGKSRLLRTIAASPLQLGTLSDYPQELRQIVLAAIGHHGETSGLLKLKGFLEDFEFVNDSESFFLRKNNLINILSSFGIGFFEPSQVNIIVNTVRNYEDPLKNSFPRSLFTNIVYIPTLRGLRPFAGDSTTSPNVSLNIDHYKKRTIEDYFDNKFSGEIYTGLTFYSDFKSLLLGDHGQRAMAREFESFLSQELFGGEQITLIPRENSDVVYFRLGDQEERKIYELGDGLQHLIILTFPLFKSQMDRCQIFIEEPELFLHPGMQRALIKAMRKFDKNQYFIATHSNHFLDLTLDYNDISIYTLQRLLKTPDRTEVDFEISLVSSHDFRVLEQLGTRSSSVFLSNCTIWIEGITDRRYFSHYLQLYQEHLEDIRQSDDPKNSSQSMLFSPRQDLHYSFVEYSGGNITHWSFLDQIDDPILVDRLCARAMLVTDKDKGKEKRHETLKEKMGDRYYCLSCLEVENLLSPETVRKILMGFGEKEIQIPEFKYYDYRNRYLGGFLDELLPQKERKGFYGEKTKSGRGTVTEKLKFSKLAIEAMPTEMDAKMKADGILAFKYEQLTQPAKELTKKMYDFIKASNQS